MQLFKIHVITLTLLNVIIARVAGRFIDLKNKIEGQPIFAKSNAELMKREKRLTRYFRSYTYTYRFVLNRK